MEIFSRFVFLAFFAVFTASCVSTGMLITNITLIDDSMVINITNRGSARTFFGNAFLAYKNIPVPELEFFDPQKLGHFGFEGMDMKITESPHGSEITIVSDLLDVAIADFGECDGYFDKGVRTLYRNEKAKLGIALYGGSIEAHIFIGEDRIDIIEQRFLTHRWR